MPQTDVFFYQDAPGDVPVLDWLVELDQQDRRAAVKCQAAIERLQAMGHELRRPQADLLRDGIYELRVRVGRVNYRVLYFFHGRGVALLAHGLTKEKAVPPADIDRAIARKLRYEADPDSHRYEGELP
jgi:phage-related protein